MLQTEADWPRLDKAAANWTKPPRSWIGMLQTGQSCCNAGQGCCNLAEAAARLDRDAANRPKLLQVICPLVRKTGNHQVPVP